MTDLTRRGFLHRGAVGLAAAGAATLTLRAYAQVTPSSGTLGAYGDYLKEKPTAKLPVGQKDWSATEDNILGPFYRAGAPFRGKITPPLEAGTVLLITGRVWGFDSRKPLAGAVLDIWQANAKGRYDNDDPKNPPAKGVFKNRARLITDETGCYEYETIHPAPYQTDESTWRPSHIHYMVQAAGYDTLVTQLYFKGDKYNATDPFTKESLIISIAPVQVGNDAYEAGHFDIVLAAAEKAKG